MNSDINQLSGIELDEAVAREVMGLEVVGRAKGFYADGMWHWSRGNQTMERPAYVWGCSGKHLTEMLDKKTSLKVYGFYHLGGHYPICLNAVPRYSEKIADAWTVLEKVGEPFMIKSPGFVVNDKWIITDGLTDEFAPTLPIAICRWALAMKRRGKVKGTA